MKKLLVLAFSLVVVSTSIPAARGADNADKPAKKKTQQTEGQRQLRKEMVDKYDTNKNGKLDKEERSKISKEDREKMKQSGGGSKRKSAPEGDKKESSQ